MKVLWLSNVVLTNGDFKTTGTWLNSLAERLIKLDDFKLGNITDGECRQTQFIKTGNVDQWIVPSSTNLRNGLPAESTIKDIKDSVDVFCPDIIHIWGTESFWGLLTARQILGKQTLLETQGLKFAISYVYSGGLSTRQQIACTGLKEVLRKSRIARKQKDFYQWGRFEKEIIANHQNITVQSDWLEGQVRHINRKAAIFRNDFFLREPFYKGNHWNGGYKKPIIFCISAYPAPFKGLHIAIRSIAILKKKYPDIELRIAGAHQRKGLRREGYIHWINRLIKQLGLDHNITWLGSISAKQIVDELMNCRAIVIPSYIEGYCLGLAEAMYLGVPAVVSFAGGASNLAKDEFSALFFSPGDESMCAWNIERIINDSDLALRLSRNAHQIALVRNNPEKIIKKQMKIYQQVLEDIV